MSTASEGDWWALTAAQSTHAGLGRYYDGFKTLCSLSLSISLSLTLSFLRGVVQSVTLEMYLFLPFLAGFRDPSSEKLTGPVQFPVSSPLSRLNCCALVRKWVSLFGICCPSCAKMSNTYNQAHVFTHKRIAHSYAHIHIYIKAGGSAFWKNSQNVTADTVRMDFQLITLWFEWLIYAQLGCCHYPECDSNIHTLQYWPPGVLRLVIQYIKVTVI